MIHNYKAPPTKWWSAISKIIDVAAYVGATVSLLICMFRHEWTEGIFWATFICVLKIIDIKELLDDRL